MTDIADTPDVTELAEAAEAAAPPQPAEAAEIAEAADAAIEPKKKGKKDKEKLPVPLKVIRIFSIIGIIANAVALIAVVLVGIASFQLSAGDLAATLEVPQEDVYAHLVIDLTMSTLIIGLSLAQAIVGWSLKKKPARARLYITLSAICLAFNAVEFIFNLSMGTLAEVSDIVVSLIGLALDVLLIFMGMRLEREYDVSSEELEAKKAAKKLKKEQKLGFMGFLQFCYAINIIATIAIMAATSRNEIIYSTSVIFNWISIVLQSLCFYLIWKRLNIARQAVIILSVVDIAFNFIEVFVSSDLDLLGAVISSIFPVIVIVYMCVAERPRRLLVKELSFELRADIDDNYIATSGWPRWRNLIIYYCVFSVIGHWMELAFCLLIQAGIVQGDTDLGNTMLWRDLLFPFPMEGIAVVICALWLYPLKQWLVAKIDKPFIPLLISFVVNGLLCTCIEFIGGITFNAQHQHWDYSNLPFNFMGQVCLQNALGFALVCTLIVWVVYPAMERFIAHIPGDVMNLVFIAVVSFNLILQVLYLVEPASVAKAFGKLGDAISSIGS